jgi:hypothetical protein
MSCFSFYLFSFFFYKIREQEGRTHPPRGKSWHQWERGGMGKRVKRANMVQKKCAHM